MNPDKPRATMPLRPPLPPRSLMENLVATAVQPVRFVPYPVEKNLLDPLIRNIFSDSAADGAFDDFRNQWIKIHMDDLAMSRWFVIGAGGPTLRPAAMAPRSPDVIMRGELKEFILLAARRADPDTLFFHRRLMIEGDTELGLLVKNLMYSVDFDRFPFPVRFALTHASDVIEQYV